MRADRACRAARPAPALDERAFTLGIPVPESTGSGRGCCPGGCVHAVRFPPGSRWRGPQCIPACSVSQARAGAQPGSRCARSGQPRSFSESRATPFGAGFAGHRQDDLFPGPVKPNKRHGQSMPSSYHSGGSRFTGRRRPLTGHGLYLGLPRPGTSLGRYCFAVVAESRRVPGPVRILK